MSAEELTPEKARALFDAAMAEDEGFRKPELSPRQQFIRDFGTEPTAHDGFPETRRP